MRCLSCCSAASYNISSLYEALRERFKTSLYRNVIHIEVRVYLEPAMYFIFPMEARFAGDFLKKKKPAS